MIFVSGIESNLTVWDAETGKGLTFVDGVYETEDERIIKLLKKLGYKTRKVVD